LRVLVDAGEVLVVAFAGLEYTWLRIGGRVELTPNAVINMLAELGGIWPCRIACFETKRV